MAETKKSLKYFMRPEAKVEQIVTAPGPDTIKGEDGKPITLEIKVLHNDRIHKIHEAYRTRKMAVDKKGNPIVANGEVVYRVDRDITRATRHIIAEALVYPDLRDKELQDYFNCYDMVDMLEKVFPSTDEFNHVTRVVLAALGLGQDVNGEDDDNKLIDDAKN